MISAMVQLRVFVEVPAVGQVTGRLDDRTKQESTRQ